MATSYVVLKRIEGNSPETLWMEAGGGAGNPDALVRELVKQHGPGVYWPVPARTRAITALVVTPDPIVKLSATSEPEPVAVPETLLAEVDRDPEPAPV